MSELGRVFSDILNEKSELDYPVIDKIFNDIHIQIENPKGTYRSGTNSDGTKWKTFMELDYGRVKGTTGRDEDMLDVFVNFKNQQAPMVYCIYQQVPQKACFDEFKYLLGMNSEQEAKEMYLKHYDDPRYFGGLTIMTIEDFKKLTDQNIEDSLFDMRYV